MKGSNLPKKAQPDRAGDEILLEELSGYKKKT